MRSHAALVIVILSLLAAGTGAAQPTVGETSLQGDVAADDGPEETVITVHVRENGDAHWNVTTRFALADENETAAFDRLADDFEDGDVETRFSIDVFERLAERSSDETGRRMSITDVQWTTHATNETGRLTLSFTWTEFARTEFARTEEERLVVDDAFDRGSGTWLPSLSANQTLVIVPPPGYAVTNSPPGVGVNNGAIRVRGPHSFASNGLEITLEGDAEQGIAALLSDLNVQELSVLAVLLTAMGVGGFGVYVWTRRRHGPSAGLRSEQRETVAEHEPTAEAAAGANADGSDAVEDEPDDVAEELLSDEERIERLIERNDGRMMQAKIVKETGWSNAKVSQLLSSMDEEGRITKLRIGRQNLIAFPDEDVTEFD